MGITTKTVIECTCDRCGQECKEPQKDFKLHLDTVFSQGETFMRYANVRVEYIVDWVGCSQVVCNKCIADWLKAIAARLEK